MFVDTPRCHTAPMAALLTLSASAVRLDDYQENDLVRVFVAQRRKIQQALRSLVVGNKGVICKVLLLSAHALQGDGTQ